MPGAERLFSAKLAWAAITRCSAPPPGAAHRFEEWRGISPFATPSVLYALFAYLRAPADPGEVLRVAVAIGGDVDMAFGLSDSFWVNMRARYGLDMARLERGDKLEKVHKIAAPNTPGTLRPLDAIHLTVAMRVGSDVFVASDGELRRAAQTVGMRTGPP